MSKHDLYPVSYVTMRIGNRLGDYATYCNIVYLPELVKLSLQKLPADVAERCCTYVNTKLRGGDIPRSMHGLIEAVHNYLEQWKASEQSFAAPSQAHPWI